MPWPAFFIHHFHSSMHLISEPYPNYQLATMTMSSLKATLSLFFLLLSVVAAASNTTLTAYEVLEEYDFPIGILPSDVVVSYDLNTTSGAFDLYLNTTCTYSIDSYELKYEPTIAGYIATDSLTGLSGIYVKVWWFWLSINEVTRDGDELKFSVSLGSAEFGVSNFEECPACGCGFDCDSVQGRKNKDNCSSLKTRFNRLVASS